VTDLHLVLCGPPDPRRNATFVGVPRVVYAGAVSRELHARLTATALCVVVPSTYEGFGLPALEAIGAGTPVVASAGSSLDEVCGEAALLVAPHDEDLAKGLTELAADEDLRRLKGELGRARSTQFNWETSAREHLRAYDDALRSS
jgi:glycosyltransferase involved in cell wall biosynthesis